MNSALRRLVSGQMPAITGMRKSLDAFQKDLKQAQVEDRLGDGVFRAGLHFVGKAAQLLIDVGHAGVGGYADGEVGAEADGVRADVKAVIEPAHDVDQADGVHVKDCGCIRIVAQLGRVAGYAKNVAQAQGSHAQQV